MITWLGRRWMRVAVISVASLVIAMYLRDPVWLGHVESGFEGWQNPPAEPPFRWIGGRASFFVSSENRWIDIPVRAPFVRPQDDPFIVQVAVNDRVAGGAVLPDEQWRTIRVPLQLSSSWQRRFARIDLHVNHTWTERRISVRVGEILVER